MASTINGLTVGKIMVGGQADTVGGSQLVHNGLVGCVEVRHNVLRDGIK